MAKKKASSSTLKPVDPEPTILRIEQLARRIMDGDILLPNFQRRFVWDKDQIISLLDSIANNYPIGSVLLWLSRQRLMSENRLADLEVKIPKPQYPVNYLLDGQQRLSTICGAMYWDGEDADSNWNLAYDLNRQEFTHLNHAGDTPPHEIRLNLLQDSSGYFERAGALESKLKARAKLLL